MRIYKPPDRFGLPPNYRWIHGDPDDPLPDISSGSIHSIHKENYGGYLSDYSNISYTKSLRLNHDFPPKVVESCRCPLLFRASTYYFN